MTSRVVILLFLIWGSSSELLEEKKPEPILKEAKWGSTISVETMDDYYRNDFLRCTIQLPPHMGLSTDELEFKPKRDEKLPKHVGPALLSSGCTIQISDTTENDIGNWTMRSYIHSVKDEYKVEPNLVIVQSFSVRIVKEVESIPSRQLIIMEKSDLLIRLKEPVPNMTSCLIINPDRQIVHLWKLGKNEKITSGSKSTDSKVEFWGSSSKDQCGAIVREIKNDTASGKWTIEAFDKEGTLYRSIIEVEIFTEISLENQSPEQLYLTLGENKTIHLTPEDAIWCRAKSMDSDKNEYCNIEFKPVKKSDAKKWHISWFTSASSKIIEKDVEFIVREPRFIETSVEELENKNSYNLMCRIKSEGIQHCIFERPDGKILNLKPGTGLGRYSYYGDGFSTSSYKESINECGLTISNAEKEDFGIWKCFLKDADKKKNQAADVSYLKVGEKIAVENIPRTGHKRIETSVSETLTITCTIRSSLDYCLIQHPDGITNFKPTENTPVDVYDLRMGLCGVQVYNLTREDSGEWGCRMGVKDAAEVITKYTVEIYDEQIVNLDNQAVNLGDSASIGCRSINNISLSYCKFKRLDGFSLHSKDVPKSSQYKFTGDLKNGLCKLNIGHINASDINTWICSIGLLDANEEFSTKIKVFSKTSTNTILRPIGTHIVLLTITGISLIVVGILVFYKYRNIIKHKVTRRYSRNAMPKPEDPVPFYLPADSPLPTKI